MKRLFLLLSFVALSAQAYVPTVEEKEAWARSQQIRRNMTERVTCAIKNRDVKLLKDLSIEMEEKGIFVETCDMIPILNNNIYGLSKTLSVLGICGIGIAHSIYDLKLLTSLQTSFWRYLGKEVLSILALKGAIYLLYRKDYQILNLLMQNYIFIKTNNDMVLMERLRRTCCSLFYPGQEGILL